MKLAIAVERYVEQKRLSGYVFRGGEKLLLAFTSRLGDADLNNLTTEHVRAYLDQTDRARIHWQDKYGVLANFLGYWTDLGAMPELALPPKRQKMRSTFVPYVFTRYHLRELLRAARRTHDCRDYIDIETMRALILFLYGTGARTEEILRLGFNEVSIKDRLISFTGKGPKDRLIPIGESLAEILSKYVAWRARRKYSGDSFLVTKFGDPVKGPTAAKHFKKLRRSAGIVRVDGSSCQPRLFDLGCTFAVHRIASWIRNGADLGRMLPALAAYMGQTGLGSTERYLALTPARFQKQLNKLSPERRKLHWRSDQNLMTFLSSL